MINKLIAHKITKNVGVADPIFKHRDDLIASDSDAASSLYSSSMKTIRRSGAVGNFKRVADGIKQEFEQMLELYCDDMTDDTFVSLSRSALDLLASKIKNIHNATGGFFVFMEFKTQAHSDGDIGDLLIALISETEVPQFNDALELQESSILDLNSLKHCARIRLDQLSENEETMITFLSGKSGAEVSKYFIDFIGCDRTTSALDASNALMSRINAWCESDSNLDARVIKQSVWNFWKENGGAKNGIQLVDLCNALQPTDPDSLLDFLTEDDSQIIGDLPSIPSKYMKKFAEFVFKGEGMTLEYERYKWSDKVEYIEASDTLVITAPPASLVKKIEDDEA